MRNYQEKLEEKYAKLGVSPEVHLEGLLHRKPINYWDYVSLETLMTLQTPLTDHPDEEIFIIYHQVTELVLKLLTNELKQMVGSNELSADELRVKLGRITRYTNLLITSFGIMEEGMDYDSYNTFRTSLAPASGFQSVQFREIEMYCTPLVNLVNAKGKERLNGDNSLESLLENLYWKDAGLDRKTGKKSLTLRQFETKYLPSLGKLAIEMEGKSLLHKVQKFQNDSELLELLKEFDYQYNVAWPMVHLKTAAKYLDSKGENKEATGGSEWKKYLHPKHQQRVFFPFLWENESILDYKRS